MELVFGVSHFPHLYGQTVRESSEFLKRIIELGVDHFDTAESYCHGHSEALLGKVASQKIRITTKIGGGYRRERLRLPGQLPYPLSHLVVETEHRINQKIRILRNQEIFQFNPYISPRDLKSHLEKSLKRLKVNAVENYLLHGYPQHIHLDYFAEELSKLRESGKVKFIGISYSGAFILDQSWIDVIQIPLASLPTLANGDSRIMIFDSGPTSVGDWPKDKIPAKKMTKVDSVIVRSRKIDHIKENLESIRKVNQINSNSSVLSKRPRSHLSEY